MGSEKNFDAHGTDLKCDLVSSEGGLKTKCHLRDPISATECNENGHIMFDNSN